MRRPAMALLAVLLFCGACAGTRGMGSRGETVAEDVRARVVADLRARNEALMSLRGMATVRYGSSLFGARGETAFAVQKPGRLRVDGLADFGLYHSRLALNGKTLTILWPSDRRYFEGEATPETLGRYLLVGLPPGTIVDLLLGVVPIGSDADLRVYGLRKGTRILVKGDGIEAVLEPREDGYFPVQYTVTDGEGRAVYRVSFGEYSREGRTVRFADRMTAQFWERGPSRTKARIDVQYKEIEINPKMDAKLFELKIPKDAERVSE